MLRIKGMTKEEASEEVRKVFEEQELDLKHGKSLRAQADDSERRARPSSRNFGVGADQRRTPTSSLHESRQHQRLPVLN
jgi:hypothetical protein